MDNEISLSLSLSLSLSFSLFAYKNSMRFLIESFTREDSSIWDLSLGLDFMKCRIYGTVSIHKRDALQKAEIYSDFYFSLAGTLHN